MLHRRRVRVLAVLIPLALSTCTNDDDEADRDEGTDDVVDVVDAVDAVQAAENTDLEPEQLSCVLDAFEEADFSQETLGDIIEADTPDEYPEGAAARIDAIIRHCTVTVDDVVEVMEGAGLEPEQARCVRDGLEDADFSQDTLGDIAEADYMEDLPEGTTEVITAILTRCTAL